MADMSRPIADVPFVLVLPGLTLAEGKMVPLRAQLCSSRMASVVAD